MPGRRTQKKDVSSLVYPTSCNRVLHVTSSRRNLQFKKQDLSCISCVRSRNDENSAIQSERGTTRQVKSRRNKKPRKTFTNHSLPEPEESVFKGICNPADVTENILENIRHPAKLHVANPIAKHCSGRCKSCHLFQRRNDMLRCQEVLPVHGSLLVDCQDS